MTRPVEPAPEVVVRLRVNDVLVATWTCSPRDFGALAAGRLVALGYLRSAADLMAMAVDGPDGDGAHRVAAAVAPERVAAADDERRHRAEHGCGPRFLLDCRPELMPSPAVAAAPDVDRFHPLFQALFERSPSRREAGGHHTAALTDGADLFHVNEEVGRHNAADRAIGGALLAGSLAERRLGLLTTARISGLMAEKAARAGIPWLASRSVPTTLALEIAAAAGITVVARAAGAGARVFAP